MKRLYLISSTILVLLYGAAGLTGWELDTAQKQRLPPDMRSPGGYRSFHFWHSGWQGGK